MDRKRFTAILAVDLAIFLAALDATIVGTAMPTAVSNLGGLHLYSWVFSIYMLTSTTTMPLFGKLADLFGQRPLFLTGIAIFTVGSLLSGLAPTMPALIVSRAVQGIGAGATFALAQTVVGTLFPPEERGKMQGYLASVWGISSICGPLAGGFIVDHWGWRWAFFVNIPAGLLAATMIWYALAPLPETASEASRPLDLFGAATLTGGIVSLLFAFLTLGEGTPWGSAIFWGPLLLALLLFAAFLTIERHAPEPLLPLTLFSNPTFAVPVLAGLLAGMAMFGALSFLPLFVQGVLLRSATQAGSVLTPMSLGWVAGSTLGGRILNRVGYRTLTLTGMILLSAGYLFLTRMTPHTTLSYTILASILVGGGMGFVNVSSVVAVQSSVPRTQIGIATTTPHFFRNIGATIGVALMGMILAGSLATSPAAVHSPATPMATTVSPETLSRGLTRAFHVGLVAALVGIAVSSFVPHTSPTRGHSAERVARHLEVSEHKRE